MHRRRQRRQSELAHIRSDLVRGVSHLDCGWRNYLHDYLRGSVTSNVPDDQQRARRSGGHNQPGHTAAIVFRRLREGQYQRPDAHAQPFAITESLALAQPVADVERMHPDLQWPDGEWDLRPERGWNR